MSMCVELFFVACFAIGFGLIRVKGSKFSKPSKKCQQYNMKVIHAEATSGNSAKAIAVWRSSNREELTSCETLKVVTQAFLDAEPTALVAEIVQHLTQHAQHPNAARRAMSVLDVVARAGEEDLTESLFEAFTQRLRMPSTLQMDEILLGGHAAAGNEEKVSQLVARLEERQQKVTEKGYSLMITGFLKNGMLDAALKQIEEMHAHGWNVPTFAVTELFRVARDSRRAAEVFRRVCEKVPATADAATIVLEECLTAQDITLAKTVESQTRQAKVQMSFGAYETLLKICIGACDMHALELFQEMQKSFSHISDGLCISLISRCAESKFVRFAEAVFAFQRSRGQMSMVVYSALMKVYSHCGMYSQACDLYKQLLADGLEPDSVMYGCLMKFSAACGRTDLTRELFSKTSGHDVHHHMAMIRAAGQDKDVDKAFSILEDMKKTSVALDTVMYNSVIDVCASAGEMQRARTLVAEMKECGSVDRISYNTLLKGYGACGDVRRAKEVITEMENAGFEPNDISYNSLINMAASSGNFQAAWDTIETMERKRVPIDNYTASIMMKALKRSQAPRESVSRVMALLDRHGIDLCSEEVLLNTAMEACIKHGEQQRLSKILAGVELKRSGMHLATHTYGTLIRASGILKRLNQCWELWTDMTEMRGLEPNGISLGCMLEALVSNGHVVEALALLRKWEKRVPANTVIYSTLIKGFGNIRDSKRAVEMWEELVAKELPLNTVVYNAIIDAHARVGSVDKIPALVDSMQAGACKPDDITWSLVAKGYCMAGDVDKAFEVFSNLKSEPNSNTVVMFNTILDGCVRHNRTDLAELMLKHMEEWRIRPTNFTLGIIVKMCGCRGQLNRAFDAVTALPKQYGFTPNHPVLTSLFFACLRNDALSSAIEVFEKDRAAGNQVDVKMFTALVSSCTRAGKLEKAVTLVEEAYGLTSGARRQLSLAEDLDFSCLEQLMKALSRRGVMQKVAMPLLQKMRAAKVSSSGRLMGMCLA